MLGLEAQSCYAVEKRANMENEHTLKLKATAPPKEI